jgi:hypothetical protein
MRTNCDSAEPSPLEMRAANSSEEGVSSGHEEPVSIYRPFIKRELSSAVDTKNSG